LGSGVRKRFNEAIERALKIFLNDHALYDETVTTNKFFFDIFFEITMKNDEIF